MVEKSEVEQKSSAELFGEFIGGLGETGGIDKFYRVEDDIDEVARKAESCGLKLTNMIPGRSYSFLILGVAGWPLDEYLPIHHFKEEHLGVWVSDKDRYEMLMEVEK